MKIFTMIVLVLACCSGCASIDKDYVDADKAFWEVITPEYLELVKSAKNADGTPKFTQEEQDRRDRTVQAWKLMIDKGGSK